MLKAKYQCFYPEKFSSRKMERETDAASVWKNAHRQHITRPEGGAAYPSGESAGIWAETLLIYLSECPHCSLGREDRREDGGVSSD